VLPGKRGPQQLGWRAGLATPCNTAAPPPAPNHAPTAAVAQVPALLLGRPAVVISPLISLMEDQVGGATGGARTDHPERGGGGQAHCSQPTPQAQTAWRGQPSPQDVSFAAQWTLHASPSSAPALGGRSPMAARCAPTPQVAALQARGISAAFLGSAQHDHSVSGCGRRMVAGPTHYPPCQGLRRQCAGQSTLPAS